MSGQNVGKVCTFEGCGRGCVAKGLCRPHYAAAYQQSAKGRETVARANAAYRQTAKGKAAVARGNAKYHQTPKGMEAAARGRTKYQQSSKGRAAVARGVAKYRQTPKGKAARSRRRARKAFAVPQRWVKRDDVPEESCYWCGADCSEIWEIEHLMPISLGGPADPSNEHRSCVDCNRGVGGKFDKHPLVWIAELLARP